MHINICSANCDLDEFLLNIDKLHNKFQVIVPTETFLGSESGWVEFPGYLAYHSIRPKPGGCVIILVDDSLDCDIVDSLLINNSVFERVGIQLNIYKKTNAQYWAYIVLLRAPCKHLIWNSPQSEVESIITVV